MKFFRIILLVLFASVVCVGLLLVGYIFGVARVGADQDFVAYKDAIATFQNLLNGETNEVLATHEALLYRTALDLEGLQADRFVSARQKANARYFLTGLANYAAQRPDVFPTQYPFVASAPSTNGHAIALPHSPLMDEEREAVRDILRKYAEKE